MVYLFLNLGTGVSLKMTPEANSILKNEIFTIPNILVFLRAALVPVFVIMYINEMYRLALVVMALAFFTDFLDGFIARKFNCITDLGKTIDPIADKLYQFSVAVCLVAIYPTMLSVAIILFVKEISMGVTGLIMIGKGGKVFGAKWYGKMSTTVVYLSMIFLFLAPIFSYEVPALLAYGLVLLCDAVLIFSAIMYTRLFTIKIKKLTQVK